MKFVALAAVAVPLAVAMPSPHVNRALYMLDSDPKGASVVAIKVNDDGSLSDPVRTVTGGKGLIGVNGTGFQNTGDPLFVQNAIVSGGNTLLTVNAGSDTVSLFHIPANDPTHPVWMSSAPSGGEVPTTIAYSEKNQCACVANSGPKAGVQCYKVSSCGKLEAAGGLMSLVSQQTKIPIVGPPGTVSDIVFNPSGTALFVSIKGDGTHEGWLYAYPVEDGKVVDKPVVSRSKDLLLDFSMSFLGSDSAAVVTDPSHGATIVSVSHDLKVSAVKSITIPFQSAICWSVYAQAYDTAFLLDAGHPNITAIDPKTGATKYVIEGSAKGGASLDSVVDRDWLYSINADNGITVIDLKSGTRGGDYCEDGPQVVQLVDLSALGTSASFTGLTLYTS